MTVQGAEQPKETAAPHAAETVPVRLERIRIRGLRSFTDVDLVGLAPTTVLIGANGSGNSAVMRLFEMLSRMLGPRRLGEFIQMNDGADDQLHRSNATTTQIEAEVSLRAGAGRNDYRVHPLLRHPDRPLFTEECFRFQATACRPNPVATARHRARRE